MTKLDNNNFPHLSITVDADFPADFKAPEIYGPNNGESFWKMDQTADLVLEDLVELYGIPRGNLLNDVARLHPDIHAMIRFELTAAFLAGADAAIAADLPAGITVNPDKPEQTKRQQVEAWKAQQPSNPLAAILAQMGMKAPPSDGSGIQVLELDSLGEADCGADDGDDGDDDPHAISTLVGEGGVDVA